MLELLRPRAPEDADRRGGLRATTSSCPTGPSSGRRGSRSRGALPERLDGLARRRARLRPRRAGARRAATRGARVTALDWAADGVELLQRTPSGTGSSSTRSTATGARSPAASTSCSAPTSSTRSGTPTRCSSVLPPLAPEVLLAEPGRPHARSLLRAARRSALERSTEVGNRVYRLRLIDYDSDARARPHRDRDAVRRERRRRLRRLPGARPVPGRERLRRARRRRDDRREPDARRRREARPVPRRDRGGRRPRDRRREHRHAPRPRTRSS